MLEWAVPRLLVRQRLSHDILHVKLTLLTIDSLLIDTGSSNTWVGAGQAYVRTSTSTQTSNRVVSVAMEFSLDV